MCNTTRDYAFFQRGCGAELVVDFGPSTSSSVVLSDLNASAVLLNSSNTTVAKRIFDSYHNITIATAGTASSLQVV